MQVCGYVGVAAAYVCVSELQPAPHFTGHDVLKLGEYLWFLCCLLKVNPMSRHGFCFGPFRCFCLSALAKIWVLMCFNKESLSSGRPYNCHLNLISAFGVRRQRDVSLSPARRNSRSWKNTFSLMRIRYLFTVCWFNTRDTLINGIYEKEPGPIVFHLSCEKLPVASHPTHMRVV